MILPSAYFYIQPDSDSYNDVLDGGFVEIRAFNLEGDFTDQIINLTLANSPQTSLLFGQLPELDPDFLDPLTGDGEVVEFKKVKDGWIFALNEVSNLSFSKVIFNFREIIPRKFFFTTNLIIL